MNKCQKCGVVILDDSDRCPLCRHVLTSDGEKPVNSYPNAVAVTKRFRFAENLFLFLSIVAVGVSLFINYTVDPEIPWSLIVGLIFFYANVVMRLAIVGRNGYIFKTLSLVILAVLMLFGIDFVTGYKGWSLNYVMPAAILLLDLIVVILMLVNRRNWQSYMMIQIFTVIVSIIPIFMRNRGKSYSNYVVWIAFFVSAALFLGTLIIGDRRARTELKRRFHI
jgi:hypothetical protein